MKFIEAIFLAVSLSMDALGIGISYGLRKVSIKFLPKTIISFISFFFTAMAINIGKVIALVLPEYLSKLIGAIMLLLLGVAVVFQAFREKTQVISQKQCDEVITRTIKAFGYTINITRETPCYKVYSKANINLQEALYLGVALSLDSFGVGISSAIAGLNHVLIPVLVGLCQFIFLSIGLLGGTKLTTFKKVKSNIFMLFSGLILIALAAVRYFL